jgi:hypothetical protein
MGITLKRQVIWRAVVTAQLREELSEELQAGADEIDERIQQIEFSTKAYITNLQRADLAQALEIRRQVETEKKRQQTQRDEILKQKEQIAGLPDGQEIIRGVLEGSVEVEIGDDLQKALAGYEIVTRDGKITEVREVELTSARRAVATRRTGEKPEGGRAPGLIITEGGA